MAESSGVSEFQKLQSRRLMIPTSDPEKAASKLVAAVKECRNLEQGKRLHAQANSRSLHVNKYVANALIRMYSKCRSMAIAKQVFDGMAHRTLVSWNSLIMGYVENGENSIAFNLFRGMDCEPDAVTYVAVLKAIGGLATRKQMKIEGCLRKGILIHEEVLRQGFDSDIYVANALLDMYNRCRCMQRGRNVFDKMIQRDVITWTCLIQGYVENGQSSLAMSLFSKMTCQPNPVTYIAVLRACGNLMSEEKMEKNLCLQHGVSIHEKIRDRALERDVFLATSLLDMYRRCGSMKLAQEVFEAMSFRTVVTWNSLLMGYVENGECPVALELFATMDCKPSSGTYVAVLKACRILASEQKSREQKQLYLERGTQIHKHIQSSGLERDVQVATSLLEMYSKCGSMQHAREFFDRMISKDVVSWTCLIAGYVENGESSRALELFESMDCEPDSFTYVAALKACSCLASMRDSEKETWLQKGIEIHRRLQKQGFGDGVLVATTLLDFYSKCGSMELAKEVFDGMIHRDVVTWNSLCMGYADNDQSLEALEMFSRMDCEPNSSTYVAALKACASLTANSLGEAIHARVCWSGIEHDQLVANALVDFYGKCGCLNRAELLFNSMHSPDVVSWNSLLVAHSAAGDSFRVLKLVKEMHEACIQLDSVTIINVLTACSHSGLVDEGRAFFNFVSLGSGPGRSLEMEHYNCMVDMLGRANRLQEALHLVKGMPFEADAVVWMTLLGDCKKWSDFETGRIAFEKLVAMKKATASAYVLITDIYKSCSNKF